MAEIPKRMITPERPDLSDEEIDAICGGLTQHLAKVRYLQRLGLRVDRRPNGRPLVARLEWYRLYGVPPSKTETRLAEPSASGPKWKTPVTA
jgi:hypothetical protein